MNPHQVTQNTGSAPGRLPGGASGPRTLGARDMLGKTPQHPNALNFIAGTFLAANSARRRHVIAVKHATRAAPRPLWMLVDVSPGLQASDGRPSLVRGPDRLVLRSRGGPIRAPDGKQ